MYARLTKFVGKKASWNILYDLQYGFRSKHITQHAILDIVNTYSKIWMMENFRAVLSSIYLKKASDTVNHEISLTKLKNYGMKGIINSWFRSCQTTGNKLRKSVTACLRLRRTFVSCRQAHCSDLSYSHLTAIISTRLLFANCLLSICWQ